MLQSMDMNNEKYIKLKESLSCPICFELYCNPHILNCGHSFCSHCIRKHFDSVYNPTTSNTCPVCREPSELSKMKPNRDLEVVSISYKDCIDEISKSNNSGNHKSRFGKLQRTPVRRVPFLNLHSEGIGRLKKIIEYLCSESKIKLRSDGDKATIERRIREFIHLNNSQLDALNPKSLEEVIAEINENEDKRDVEIQKAKRSSKEVDDMKNGKISMSLDSNFKRLAEMAKQSKKASRLLVESGGQEATNRHENISISGTTFDKLLPWVVGYSMKHKRPFYFNRQRSVGQFRIPQEIEAIVSQEFSFLKDPLSWEFNECHNYDALEDTTCSKQNVEFDIEHGVGVGVGVDVDVDVDDDFIDSVGCEALNRRNVITNRTVCKEEKLDKRMLVGDMDNIQEEIDSDDAVVDVEEVDDAVPRTCTTQGLLEDPKENISQRRSLAIQMMNTQVDSCDASDDNSSNRLRNRNRNRNRENHHHHHRNNNNSNSNSNSNSSSKKRKHEVDEEELEEDDDDEEEGAEDDYEDENENENENDTDDDFLEGLSTRKSNRKSKSKGSTSKSTSSSMTKKRDRTSEANTSITSTTSTTSTTLSTGRIKSPRIAPPSMVDACNSKDQSTLSNDNRREEQSKLDCDDEVEIVGSVSSTSLSTSSSVTPLKSLENNTNASLSSEWECTRCTFLNLLSRKSCEMCGNPQKSTARLSFSSPKAASMQSSTRKSSRR